MDIIILILSILLLIASVLPFVPNPHWLFRVPDFMRLQILVLQVPVVVFAFLYAGSSPWKWGLQVAQLVAMAYHIYLLVRYTAFWKRNPALETAGASTKVKVISCNVYQYNHEYHRLMALVKQEKPDILLTMESNSDWEEAMRELEADLPNTQKVTLENTYGMHLYTKLKVRKLQTHFFVSDDLPSIEAELETEDGHRFVFFGVHPPPPSPTEEDTSKERDGDLLSVAKRVRNYNLPVVVTGDFNTVAWSNVSRLFAKTAQLIDARIGRGLLATFHAKYWFFRVPLDLLFHSEEVFVDKLFIYPSVGSDHFPIGCSFHIDKVSDEQDDESGDLESGEMAEVDEMIQEGRKEESNNR